MKTKRRYYVDAAINFALGGVCLGLAASGIWSLGFSFFAGGYFNAGVVYLMLGKGIYIRKPLAKRG